MGAAEQRAQQRSAFQRTSEEKLLALQLEHYSLPPAEARCTDCRFFDPLANMGGTIGDCRLNPPTIDMMPVMEDNEVGDGFTGDSDDGILTLHMVAQTDVTRRGIWPQVGSDDWCGEWRATPDATG